jgi:hypothetical protein
MLYHILMTSKDHQFLIEEQRKIDASLDELALTITRLKNLSILIGDRIESQGKLIDDVSDKVEKTSNNTNKTTNKIKAFLGIL